MKRFVSRSITFTLIPVLALEVFFRINPYIENCYQERINPFWKVDDKLPVRYVFIGTSRVAAAILEDQLKTDDTSGYYVNAGRGYTTGAIQYLGLRYLAEEKHARLNGATILVESPMGNCLYPDRWENSLWINGSSPQLIIPFLKFRDLRDLWRFSSNTFAEKLNVSLLYSLRCYRYTAFIHEILSRNAFRDLLVKTRLIKAAPETIVIAGKGGIKTDTASIHQNKNLITEYYADFKESMQVMDEGDFSLSIFNDMARLSARYEARLGVFSIPLTSVQKSAYECGVAQENANEFKAWLDSKNIMFLDLEMKTSDSDFPDLWHLSSFKALEFTKVLEDSLNRVTHI